MAKQASDLTMAIRQLCQDYSEYNDKGRLVEVRLTHSQGRPLLKAMGFKIVSDPGRRSTHLKALDDYDVKITEKDAVEVVGNTLGITEDEAKVVVREGKKHIAFKAERNNFDVTKQIWKKNHQSGEKSKSAKPVSAKPVSAKPVSAKPVSAKPVSAKPVSAKTPTTSGDSEFDSLTFVEANGGVSGVESMIAAKKAEIDAANAEIESLQKHVDTVAELQKRLKNAA